MESQQTASERSESAKDRTDRLPLLRWAAIGYSLLAAAALAWNEWSGRPWAYLDPAASASRARSR